ncbi:hypothetical protein PHJA_000428700 [Phtheirospermum japonicum]|uniref:PB1 domain-containing protein n=1 Tax=Phtheirospermum japonicum TaxID=374723 RepID=A0A830B777_9LAMI|nr:hypothetical protein PHJA_000428700 [Phtheirospermum japonicum]
MGKMCGSSVSLRCQLPTEYLDALVSITSDEDLANQIKEYNYAAAAAAEASAFKIRAFLYAPKTLKKVRPPPSIASFSSSDASLPKLPFYSCGGGGMLPRCPTLNRR